MKPGLYSLYQNSQGQTVRLDCCVPMSGQVIIYKNGCVPFSEHASSRNDSCTAQEVVYLGYDMLLVEWKNARQIYWLDDEEGLRYCLYADGLTERQFWDLVYDLAKK